MKSDSTLCVVQKPTQQHQASWPELSVLSQGQAGQVSVFRLYCNWFLSDFTLLSVSIYLFYWNFKVLKISRVSCSKRRRRHTTTFVTFQRKQRPNWEDKLCEWGWGKVNIQPLILKRMILCTLVHTVFKTII